MSRGKLLFSGVWLALVLASFAALKLESRLQFGQGTRIARLSSSQGVVQFRTRDLPIWGYAGEGQVFYEENIIATGNGAAARITFDDGMELDVRQNSQVVLAARKDGGEGTGEYVVTLLGGSLQTASEPAAKASGDKKLVLRVEGREVKLADPTARVSVRADARGPAVVKVEAGRVEVGGKPGAKVQALAAGQSLRVQPAADVTFKPSTTGLAAKLSPGAASAAGSAQRVEIPLVTLAGEDDGSDADAAAAATTPARTADDEEDEAEGEDEGDAAAPVAPTAQDEDEDDEEEEAPAPPPAPEPAPPAPKPERVAAPKITQPPAGATLWTALPIGDKAGKDLVVGLARPSGGGAQTRYFVEAADAPGKAFQANAAGKAMIPAAALKDLSKSVSERGLPLRRLRLRAGATSAGGKREVAARTHDVMLGSLRDVAGGGGMRVLLKSLSGGGAAAGWALESPQLGAGAAAAVIDLRETALLPRLAGLIVGAGEFALRPLAGGLPADGAFVVRKGQIIAAAQLAGSAGWDTVRRALDADLVFRGPGAALVAGFAPGAEGSGALLAGALKTRTIYVLQGGQLKRIDASLVRGNASATELIGASAAALFTREVRLLSVRQGL